MTFLNLNSRRKIEATGAKILGVTPPSVFSVEATRSQAAAILGSGLSLTAPLEYTGETDDSESLFVRIKVSK